MNIYIVAASDAEQDEKRKLRWGDYWFKDSLAKALTAQGHTVSANPGECDVLINCHGSGIENLPVHTWNVLWVIGHPDRVTANECAQYDAVYAESEEYTAHLREQGVECAWLPGATDFVAMGSGDVPQSVFVGNWRPGREKMQGKYPLRIWGEGWTGHLPEGATLEGNEYPHDKLASLYGDSADLPNDTHADMAKWGMHNPRYYDILATRGEPAPTFAECAARIMAGVPEKRVMYDLGCGKQARRGMVGVDKAGGEGVIQADLENGLGFGYGTSVIVADNVLEHIHNFIPLMNDCHEALRQLPSAGRLHITVPNAAKSLDAAFSDPTHVRQFTPATFDYFNGEHTRWKEYGQTYGIKPWRVLYARERDGRFIDVMMRPA